MSKWTLGVLMAVTACAGRYEQLPDGSSGPLPQASSAIGAAGASAGTDTAGGSAGAAGAGPSSADPSTPASPSMAPPATPTSPVAEASAACSCDANSPTPDFGWSCALIFQATDPQVIGPAGGELRLDDAANVDGVPFTVSIPRGALSKPTALWITDSLVPPVGFAPTTPGYAIEPLGVTFELPVAVRVPWGPTLNDTQPGFGLFFAPDACSMPAQLSDSYVNAGFMQGALLSTGVVFSGSHLRMPDTR